MTVELWWSIKAEEEVRSNSASEESLLSHIENSGIGSKGNGKSVKGVKQVSESIKFAFLKDHADYSLEAVLEKSKRENYESR